MKKSEIFAGTKPTVVRKAYEEMDDAPQVNPEGQASFELSLRERFLNTLLCNMIGGTYYSDVSVLAEKAKKVHEEMLEEDPEFYAKALIYARNTGYVKEQPAIGMVYLTTLLKKDLAYKAFDRVIKIPSDITKFIDHAKSGAIRKGLGSTPKELIRKWLKERLSEYYAIKYPKDITIAIKLSHPNTSEWGEKNEIVDYVMGADKPISENTPQIGAFESLKRNPKNRKLIAKGRLPHEVVSATADMTKEAWVELMPQMPYFALLRHLSTLQRHEVFDEEENVDYAIDRLSSPEAVHKSKLFPFRFWSAYKAFCSSGGNQRIANSLSDAMEISFDNVPEIKGRTLVGMDSSGSMSCRVDDKSTTRYIDIAAIFATAVVKKSPKSEAVAFDTELRKLFINPRDSILSTVQKIATPGGGTDIGLPLQYATLENPIYDNIVVITDSIEWRTRYMGYDGSYGFLGEWRRYLEKKPEAKCFYIRIDSYLHSPSPQGETGIINFYGWNENVLRVIAQQAEGIGTQIDEVEKVSL